MPPMEISAWHAAPPCILGLAWAVWARERARRQQAEQAAAALRTAQQSTLRLLRLSTGDQRNLALTLIGHAESLQPADPALTGLARCLLEMSDTLVAQTEDADGPRYITDETVALLPAVEFALDQLSAHLGPARRAWRIDPALADTHLLADRRALNQVLVSVLTAAATSTRDGDWIEISLQQEAAETALVVQDEGVGLPVAAGGRHPGESRGIGLRLTLARSLMQAHGGSLTVQSAERVGTRVRLGFPATRLLQAVGERPDGAVRQLSLG